MSREDVHKLLGGYATGTLTPEEQQMLFEAALQDQELFDALAREQALRDVLGDPAARAQLLAAIDEPPVAWYRRWWRPLPIVAMAGGLAAMAIVALWQNSPSKQSLRMAKLDLPPIARVEEAAPPVLPPPPDLAPQARRDLRPLALPARIAPIPPPPPPAPAAAPVASAFRPATTAEKKTDIVLDGALGGVAGQLQSGQSLVQPVPAPQFGVRSALLPQSGLLRGSVTDPTGAPIGSASVELKSLSTGEVLQISTNQLGEFAANETPGRTYEIKVQAPGFQSKTVSSVVPFAGAPPPVNLQLDVGAATETVEVQASAATPAVNARGGGGRGGRGATADSLAKQAVSVPQQPPMLQSQEQRDAFGMKGAVPEAAGVAVSPSLQYRAMRRMADGSLVEIGADGSVAAGAALILRVTPNVDGYLRISRGKSVIENRPLHAAERVDIPLRKFSKGRVELTLDFSTEPAVAKAFGTKALAASAAPGPAMPAGKDAPPPFHTTITLNFQ